MHNSLLINNMYVTLHSTPVESRLQTSLLSTGVLYSRSQRAAIPDAV